MNSQFRLFLFLAVGFLIGVPGLSAQDPTTLGGRITSSTGEGLVAASILIPSMNIGVSSNNDGRYVLIVPAARATGQAVTLNISLIGRVSQTVVVTLTPGTQEFNFVLAEDPLLLDEIVVTGLGLATRRLQLGVTINSVRAEEIALSREMQMLLERLVATLPGKLRNVFRLSTVEGMTSREIAPILNIPEASVRTRLFRARKLLQEKVSSLVGTQTGRST